MSLQKTDSCTAHPAVFVAASLSSGTLRCMTFSELQAQKMQTKSKKPRRGQTLLRTDMIHLVKKFMNVASAIWKKIMSNRKRETKRTTSAKYNSWLVVAAEPLFMKLSRLLEDMTAIKSFNLKLNTSTL